ncbi:MAG: hypothetical protein KatS3mg036_0463 [Ignavibacterium sp.]|nr:MAG: hypothetical protein KatS3mg036_0463 [Ignavibacterium sp.]
MKSFLIFFLFFFQIILSAQDGGVLYEPDYSNCSEGKTPYVKAVDLTKHFELDKKLKAAIESGDRVLERQIRLQMDELYKDQIKIMENNGDIEPITVAPPMPNSTEWINGDIKIFDGYISQLGSGNKRIDIKLAEDGNLYVALIQAAEGNFLGRAVVYSSSNGGATWNFIGGMQSQTLYFAHISMAVELMSNTNFDSTKILLFVSASENPNFNDATIRFASFLRNNTSWYSSLVLTPSAGNKLLYPSVVTDGQYYSLGTFIGVTCGEYKNDYSAMIQLHFARSTDWGQTFVTSQINDSYFNYGDWYPVSAFKKSSFGVDSIYIAVERRFANTSLKSKVRIISTPWTPSSAFFRYLLSNVDSIEYQKPDISILQDASSLPKRIIVAAIKNGTAIYHYSTNGGTNWYLDGSLGLSSEDNITCVSVNSDSNKSNNGYFIAAYQFGYGDTIVVRRGVLGSLGTRLYKPNSYRSSIISSPKVAIYRSGLSQYSSLIYAGVESGYTKDLYFDQESLTSVSDDNILSNNFLLYQNYPNPFNPTTKIVWQSPVSGWQTLKVYDVLGNEVTTLVNEYRDAGRNEVEFHSAIGNRRLASGVYYYQLKIGQFIQTKKMMLIK